MGEKNDFYVSFLKSRRDNYSPIHQPLKIWYIQLTNLSMKKIIKWLFLSILLIIVLFSAFAVVTGKTYLFKAVYYNFADIDDYKIFTNDTVRTSAPQPWPVAEQFNKFSSPDSLNKLLEDIKTIAVVVIKNDSLLYEKY